MQRTAGVKRVYFSSSSEVYGESVHFPQHEETTPLNSRLPYAIVKNASEAYLKSYHQEYGSEYTIFRFFNTFRAKAEQRFCGITIHCQGTAVMNPYRFMAMETQMRTFCYIDDNVDATVTAFEKKLYVK